ncbi:MAG: hypothetical protein JXR91_13975, partial [Deltaproteobacteria bacterium]|nr:hypothetical protein [Deltaproteobacteria bacterium]
MKIRTKILLLLILGAIVPLAVSYVFADRLLFYNFKSTVEKQIKINAFEAADKIDVKLNWMVDSCDMAMKALPLENVSFEELTPVLAIPFNQLNFINVIAVIDKQGKSVVPPFYLTGNDARMNDRKSFGPDDLNAFAKSIPCAEAFSASMAIGPVFLLSDGSPSMVIAIKVPSYSGESMVAALGVSLESMCNVDIKDKYSYGVLLDNQGNNICGNSDNLLKKNMNFKVVESLNSGKIKD